MIIDAKTGNIIDAPQDRDGVVVDDISQVNELIYRFY